MKFLFWALRLIPSPIVLVVEVRDGRWIVHRYRVAGIVSLIDWSSRFVA